MDPDIQLDERYAQWGPYKYANFIEWWPAHAHLFKVHGGVRLCESAADAYPHADSEIILRVPLSQSKKQSVLAITQILDKCEAGNPRFEGRAPFQLSVGISPDVKPIDLATRFLRNLDKIKLSDLPAMWVRRSAKEAHANDGLSARPQPSVQKELRDVTPCRPMRLSDSAISWRRRVALGSCFTSGGVPHTSASRTDRAVGGERVRYKLSGQLLMQVILS